MTVYFILQLVYDLVLLAVSAYALTRGGRDERIATIFMLIASTVSTIVAALPGYSWLHDGWKIASIDFALLGGLGLLASVSDRFWPLWATAFQLVDVATHGVILLSNKRVLVAFVFSQAFWAYLILLMIALGTRFQVLSRRKGLYE